MPFTRPALSDLRTQVLQDIASALPGSDPLLRFSNLNILGLVQAGLAHLHYGYLDWISGQAVPFSASAEFLEAWAALKNVFRLPATVASGTVTFTGTSGTVIPSGTPLVRGDGQTYATSAAGTLASGTVTVPAAATPDPAGLAGAIGNCATGTVLTISSAIAGVNSNGAVATAFAGGADLEGDDSLRARMLLSFQNPPHGGAAKDYVEWALAIPGVTRAWASGNLAGAGTVTVWFMMDNVESAYGGFPQGTDGVSQFDIGPGGTPRDVVATGDQLRVADAICPQQPVTALVYVKAPVQHAVAFTVTGVSGNPSLQAKINAAIDAALFQQGTVSGATTTVDLSYVEAAINVAVPQAVVTSPTTNISTSAGQLPVRGTVTYP